MKVKSFPIGDWQTANLTEPIRNKREAILLLMHVIKLILVHDKKSPPDPVAGEIRLIVSKMSRIFLLFKEKYISFRLPFTLIEKPDGSISFRSAYIEEIDSQVTSQIIACLKDNKLDESTDVLEWADQISDTEVYSPGFWPTLRDLLLSEDGYLRYECDSEHQNGRLHPLHHYDIFYSNHVTFKVGLETSINSRTMIDLLERETDCHFFQKI